MVTYNFSRDHHKNECENEEYYYCSVDDEIVHESEKNICPVCLLFIPRFSKKINCVCDYLVDAEPDYDYIRKYEKENPPWI
tara:strand:- start:8796 stop:9038 length:243 start_codon:yes stop_codon:yes gene_type:complete